MTERDDLDRAADRVPDSGDITPDYAGSAELGSNGFAPEVSEPEPTAPEPTAPEPTAPEPTEPDPTEPDPTEPDPTGSAPDEPSALEARSGPDDVPRPPRRLTSRTALAAGARSIAGLIGVAVAVAAIAGATVITEPRYAVTPPAASVDPVPAAQQRVCAGPLLRLGDETGQDATTASSIGRTASVYQAVPRDAEVQEVAITDNTSVVPPLLLTLPPGESDAGDGTALAGSQSQAIGVGDLNGFAAAECAEASGDIWLVGGAADVGRTTLITISNPSTVIATVALSIYGETGTVAAPGAEGIVVPPGAQRIFSLAGFAPGLVAPVIRVQSRGGQVVANLQQAVVRTLEPGGVEIVGATGGPATSAIIPGLVVQDTDRIEAAQSRAGYADLATLLRVFVPGEVDASVDVSIRPEIVEGAEPADVTEFTIALPAGETSEVPFSGLGIGSYTVTVDSSVPVVSGVRMSGLSPDERTDFAWLAAAQPLGEVALLSVAPGPTPTMHLVNPDGTEATVTLEATSGSAIEDLTLVVPAGETVSVALRGGTNYTMTASAGVLATVTYSGAGQFSAFRVTPPGPASTEITVYR